MLKTIFIGTPDFAVPALKALIDDDFFDIKLVITQPDMPAGRDHNLVQPLVKQTAINRGLKVIQPQKISLALDQLRELAPDIIIVVAYSQIIPLEILNLPKYGCINLHGSLLPRYRGAAVVNWPIINNDQQSGLTAMLMDQTLDTGPILAQIKCPIKSTDTAGELYDRLADLGGAFLIKTIKDYVANKIKPQVQDEAQANYVKRLTKQDGLIDWNKSALEIERFVRGLHPWPTAWTWWRGLQVKILAVQPEAIEINSYKPGKTFIYNSGLAIQCGQDSLIVKKIQLEGRKELPAEQFLMGQKDFVGSVLG